MLSDATRATAFEAGPAHLWDMRVPDTVPDGLLAILSAEEMEAMRRFHRPSDALRFATRRAAMRVVLGHTLGREPRQLVFDRACRHCGGDHGKPRVDGGVDFSVSSSGQRVLMAITDGGAIGVDIEERTRDAADMAARVLAPGERETVPTDHAIDRWCCKEALLKATGYGLAIEPSSIELVESEGCLRAATVPPKARDLLRFSISPLVVAADYAAAMAFEASR